MKTAVLAYFLDSFGSPLRSGQLELPAPADGEAVVEVEACGMCHTDLGYALGSVKPNHPLPLVLGHEVVGRVLAVGGARPELVGREVVVPAVLPCMDCDFCHSGRSNACPRQKMPGNDIHGGFATHMVVPARPLIPVDDAPDSVDVRSLSVVADAVSTAYQAVRRSGLAAGDAAFVVGAGGVGSFVVQIAQALGAHVAACDIQPSRLDLAGRHGADMTMSVEGRTPRDVKKALHGWAKEAGVPSMRYRIFECSGTAAGQEVAYALLHRAATLLFVGYTFDKVTVRLSNLMAFDATAAGSWGCPPEAYPEVLKLVYEGQVVLDPFIEAAPMSTVNEQLEAMAAHRLDRRMVLDPTA